MAFGRCIEEAISLLLKSSNCVWQFCNWLCWMQFWCSLGIWFPQGCQDPGSCLGVGIQEHCALSGLHWRHPKSACQLSYHIVPFNTLPEKGPGVQRGLKREAELGLSAGFRAIPFWILQQDWPSARRASALLREGAEASSLPAEVKVMLCERAHFLAHRVHLREAKVCGHNIHRGSEKPINMQMNTKEKNRFTYVCMHLVHKL